MTPFDRLADAIAKSQDAELAHQVALARQRLALAPVRQRLPVRRAWQGAVALAVAVAAVIGVRSWTAAPPITFEIGARHGAPREQIAAPATEGLSLRFSDKTTVLLAADTRGEVDDLTPRGARLRLDRGRAAVSVPPQQNADWAFDVGPFEVAVTGTRFDVGWDDQGKVFELVMHDGSVKVTGPTITGRRIVIAGETLRIPLGPETVASAPAPAVVPAEPMQDAPTPPEKSADHKRKPGRLPASLAPTPTPAPTPASWQALAASGQFQAALSAVLDQFENICATASAAEVTILGDTARYAGDLAHAQQAYLAVRQRFSGAATATATFALARIAFQAPDDAMAIRWLTCYLSENPSGALAREALGRLLEVYARTHDDVAARRVAERYLRDYPTGPHAKLAHSVLGP